MPWREGTRTVMRVVGEADAVAYRAGSIDHIGDETGKRLP